MRINFKWFITFSLMFITLFSFQYRVQAVTEMDNSLFSQVYPTTAIYKDSNVFIGNEESTYTYNNATYKTYTVIFYSSPAPIKLSLSGTSMTLTSTQSISKFACNWRPRYAYENVTTDQYKGFMYSPIWNTSDAGLTQTVNVSGNTLSKIGDVSYSDGSSPGTSTMNDVLNPRTSLSDILNYNWVGDGIKIYNLTPTMNVSGYQDTAGLKYFDIETYGKFTYNGSSTFFTSIAYKKMQTNIQLASILTYGSQSRRCGEGLGIKSFEWISDTSHLNAGDVVKFRIVYQAPMLDKGVYDISLGTTYNNGVSDLWISDTVKSINFLNENSETGVFNNTGETGNVGSQAGNIPRGETDISVNGSLTSLLTMFSSFSAFVGTLFGFLPSEVKILFVGACVIITGLMVKRAVL